MATIVMIIGFLSLAFGIALLWSPQTITKMGDGLNRMVTKLDEQVLKYRIGVGVSLLIVSLFLFFYAYKLGGR